MTGSRGRAAAVLFAGVLPAMGFLAFAAWLSGGIVTDVQDELQWGLATFMTSMLLLIAARFFVMVWLGYLHHLESLLPGEPGGGGPPVSIIVPAYNEETIIQASIRSLLRLNYSTYEIVVVDDGSSDRTGARASELAGRYGRVEVRVISKRNGGKADALNYGIAQARYPYVVCVDGDSVLAPDTLRYAMRHFEDPRVGAVGGNVKVVNRNNLWTRTQALEYVVGLNLTRRAQGFLRSVSIVPGPVGVFRRDVLEAVGGYDLDTFAEDADLTLKILAAGWQVSYEERATAYTEAPESLLELIKQRYRWSRGMLQAMSKRGVSIALPRRNLATWFSFQLMLFEALVWPLLDLGGNLIVVSIVLAGGATFGAVLWVSLLTLFEIAATLHCVALEREELTLVPYAVISRLVYGTLLQVVRLLAIVDEFARVRMTWGKLQRMGRIAEAAP